MWQLELLQSEGRSLKRRKPEQGNSVNTWDRFQLNIINELRFELLPKGHVCNMCPTKLTANKTTKINTQSWRESMC